MNNIKITVEYETPTTNKFDELMAQYETIKQTADDTVAYYKPLADMAEETKFLAIREQCQTIVKYLETLHNLNKGINSVSVRGTKHDITSARTFSIEYDGRIMWNNCLFTLEIYKTYKYEFNAEYYDDYNILGNWDKWNVYARLEEQCLKLLNAEIEKQKNRGIAQKNRLANITETEV